MFFSEATENLKNESKVIIDNQKVIWMYSCCYDDELMDIYKLSMSSSPGGWFLAGCFGGCAVTAPRSQVYVVWWGRECWV